MKKKIFSKTGILIVGLIAGTVLAMLGLAQGRKNFWREAGPEPAIAFNAPQSFAPLAEKIIPAVVTVYTSRTVGPFEFEPGQFFFFFGPGPRKERGMGSGFIITPDGYILTNNHVVANADVIKVEIGVKDKKKYNAKKIGADDKTDIALIKIDAKDLPTLALGDSEQVQPGDWVLAVGSPFQFPHTLTAGIVSAKARHLGGPYDDFIQTDASINPGNSGGPLVNMRGEVIGINTIIVSPMGANIGLGFAIPINLVKSLLPELKEKGKVIRSWLGVGIQEITPELAESYGLKETKGILINQVNKNSPADKAGLKVNDIILEVDGKPVESEAQLRLLISSYPPGTQVRLKIFRDGQTIEKTITLEMRPEEGAEAEKIGRESSPKTVNILGVKVTDLTPEKAQMLGFIGLKGALVVSVSDESILADELAPNDLIVELNGREISSSRAFNELVANLSAGDLVRIRYIRSTPQGIYSNIFAFRVPKP